jgi:hypothetical protein
MKKGSDQTSDSTEVGLLGKLAGDGGWNSEESVP